MKNEKRALFQFPLPVRFKIGDTAYEESIEISKEREDFYIALDAAPSIVRLDPDLSVLAKIDFTVADELLLAQLGDSSDAIGRIEAVKQLAKKKNKLAVEKLAEALNADAFFAVREAAAKGLGSVRSSEAFEALQKSLVQEDARVRQSVVQAVRNFYSDDAYNLLKSLVDQESNPGISTIAIRELGKYSKPDQRNDLLKLLQSESYDHAVARAAIDAMGAQDDPFYVDPLLRILETDEEKFTSGGFSSAMIVLGRLAKNEESKTEVRTFLMRQVDHLKRNVARAAMRALGELHDPKAIPLLESFVAADRDSKDGRAAKQALDILRKEVRAPVPEEVNRLRNHVSDLDAQLKRVNEDLKNLRSQFKEALEVSKAKRSEVN